MKIIKHSFFAILYLVFSMSFSYAATISELGKTTIYLREQVKCYEKKGGKEYEIWFKDIKNQELQPKLTTSSGTGFIIRHHEQIYLVTAAHVVKNMSDKAEVLWNTASGKNRYFTFEELEEKLPYSKWFFHPSADIAIHPLKFTKKSGHKSVPGEIFVTLDEIITPGTKVCIWGFPLNLGIEGFLSPILKKAEIASWITTIDNPKLLPDLKFILLDEDLASGYSGAPVFISPELQTQNNKLGVSQPKLIGILCGVISDKTGGKISLVAPISYLNEIFTLDDFRAYEKKIGVK